MRKRSKPAETPPAQPSESRLGGIRALAHDEDERPSREDRTYGETIFNRGVVPLPRFLVRGRRSRG
ncbi:MAG TPA: hypothetical protein VFN44_19250 [Solirubrobacteraceae bacterium]|nr:hypothetical protein [Solirubrobacteraceae bacterium]